VCAPPASNRADCSGRATERGSRAPWTIASIGKTLAALALVSLGCRPDAPSRSGSTPAPRSPAPATAPAFLARLEFPTARSGSAKPTGLLAGDLDGDGRDELIAATRSPGGIEIWSGISPVLGPAPEPRVFAFGDYALGPVWVAAADPARKRARSLAAVVSRETLELAVIDLAAALRSKVGSELPVAWRARVPARPRAIAGGDLGRDGRGDVLVITIEDELLLYGGSEAPRRLALAKEHAVCALLASDGERIAVGYQTSRRIALVRADGTAEKSAELPGIPRALAEADLDGDGDSELAVAAGDDLLLVFGLGRGGGCAAWLDAKPSEVKVGRVPIAIAHADFEGRGGNGREELAVLGLHDQDVRIQGFAGGVATTLAPLAPLAHRAAGQRPFDLAVGDFDGDGAPDLAVANSDARRVGLLFGASGQKRAGPCFVSEARVPCDRSPISIAAGDVDGDGHPDVVVLAAADETLSVLRNENGDLVRAAAGTSTPNSDAVACADLDGDGKAEIACLQRGTDRTSIAVRFAYGGDNIAEAPSVMPLQGRLDASDLLLADLDGDRRMDAVVARPSENLVAVTTILAGSAKRVVDFSPPQSVRAMDGPCALARLRGGADAIFVAVADGGPGPSRGVTLLRASQAPSGVASLEPGMQLAMPQFPIALCAADLDGDGREDLAVLATESGGDSQGLVIPWIAKADGGWRALDPMPTGTRPHRIAACDLDGDGKAEILITAQGSHHVEVWLARAGDPVRFVRGPDLGAGTGPLDIVLVDLDGDGRKEIVVANGFSDDVSVIRVR
jgi:hypothetical protein